MPGAKVPQIKTLVSLRLTSETKSPEQIFAELGVPAQKTWRKGERRGKTSILERNNGYEFTGPADESMSLEERAGALMDRLGPIIEAIRRSGCDNVELACVVYASTVPAINFPPSVIDTLSRLGASIDVDLYVAEANWMG